MPCSTSCPCLSDADWRLQSDIMPCSRFSTWALIRDFRHRWRPRRQRAVVARRQHPSRYIDNGGFFFGFLLACFRQRGHRRDVPCDLNCVARCYICVWCASGGAVTDLYNIGTSGELLPGAAPIPHALKIELGNWWYYGSTQLNPNTADNGGRNLYLCTATSTSFWAIRRAV